MLVDALEDAGFSTLEAADGDHAIRLLEIGQKFTS
jgi:hypothetical protein